MSRARMSQTYIHPHNGERMKTACQNGNVKLLKKEMAKLSKAQRKLSDWDDMKKTLLLIVCNSYNDNHPERFVDYLEIIHALYPSTINVSWDSCGTSPLIQVCRSIIGEMLLKELLDRGVDPNIYCSSSGNTALHCVCDMHDDHILYFTYAMKLLIEHGADYTLKNRNGQTPLDLLSDWAWEKLTKDFQNWSCVDGGIIFKPAKAN